MQFFDRGINSFNMQLINYTRLLSLRITHAAIERLNGEFYFNLIVTYILILIE